MGLDLAKIGQLAQDCSRQELHAAAIWQQRFHNFNGTVIIRDLARQPHLWSSFCFAPANEGTAQETWGVEGIIETLLAMATERATPATRGTRYAPYPANTLYVLAAKQDNLVNQLVALGAQWCADEMGLYIADDPNAVCPSSSYLKAALQDAVLDERGEFWQEAVIASYWWQHDTLLHRVAPHTNLTAGVGSEPNASSQGEWQAIEAGWGIQERHACFDPGQMADDWG